MFKEAQRKDEQIKELREDLQSKEKQISQIEQDMDSLVRLTPIVPIEVTMENYKVLKAHDAEWNSPPFYTLAKEGISYVWGFFPMVS